MNTHHRPQAILIAGPTASGKSAAAIELARRLNGVVINADSMQVYADLRVLSARPTREEEALAPHDLFGFVDGAENFSVGRYMTAAAEALARAKERGLLPIFAGGTGLYFKALIRGLSEIPATPPEVRARVRAAAEGVPPQDLHARLAARDPAMAAKLRPSDPQRILRALEVFEATGRSLASFQGARTAPLLDIAQCVAVFLAPEREALNKRINERFSDMMFYGGTIEVKALMARSLDPALPIMRAHGVPGFVDYFSSYEHLDGAMARGKADTRRYAKRQHTFARHQLPEFEWVGPEAAVEWVMARAAP